MWSQPMFVITGQKRGDNIGRVQPSAQTHLHYSYIHLLFGKYIKCQCYRHFKKRRLYSVKICPVLCHKINNGLLAYHFTVYADALPKVL
jgi:TRAP-type uncharacterized transport system fused permease subunit